MATLNPDQRTAVELISFEGLTFEELATRTAETLSNAKHHYYRGMMKLREFLSEKSRDNGAIEGATTHEEKWEEPMLEHAKYEELCALAAAGQISAEEFAEFQSHLQECGHCQGLHQELLDINSIWLTQAQELEPEMYGQHSVLRTKILGTLQDAGAQFSEPSPQRNRCASLKIQVIRGIPDACSRLGDGGGCPHRRLLWI